MRARSVLSIAISVIMLALPVGNALAAGSSSSSSSQDIAAKLDRAEKMIDSGDARDAIPVLEQVIESDSDNADAYNFLGLAHRKLGQYDQSKKYYDKALSLDPEHKGAHEYLGELFLSIDQPQKAKQHLARLDEICTYGCEEYDMLQSAIEDYSQSQ